MNRQAKAADRQAAAAEQVLAAKSATAVSEAQGTATEQGAMAEREHSELIRHQTLANLRPILVITERRLPIGVTAYSVENHGEGVAQTAFEVDANGGHLIQPRIVPERRN